MKRKFGIVDVGGGYRGVYAAGVLNYCMEQKITFDLGIGVSAGSANLISFAAGQHKRNYQFYTEYGLRKEYAGIKNFLFQKSFVDLDYVYSTLSNSDGDNEFSGCRLLFCSVHIVINLCRRSLYQKLHG